MDYWTATMQDDVYLLVQEGWKAVVDGKPNTDLIPPPFIIGRYFAEEQAVIEELEAKRDAITSRLEEVDEEHGGDDGFLADARSEKGKLTKATVEARFADIKSDADAADERKVLKECLDLIEDETTASKKVKDAQKSLDARVAAKYPKLSVEEIQTLVVDDKRRCLRVLHAEYQGFRGRREVPARARLPLTTASSLVCTAETQPQLQLSSFSGVVLAHAPR